MSVFTLYFFVGLVAVSIIAQKTDISVQQVGPYCQIDASASGKFQLPTDFPATSASIGALIDSSTGLPSLNFVLAAQIANADSSGLGIYAMMFSVDPQNVTNVNTLQRQFQVNTVAVFDQKNPVIATLSNGGFVIVYESTVAIIAGSLFPRQQRILFQLYDRNGNPIGLESQVNQELVASRQDQYPSTSALRSGDGGFVVSWITARVDSANNVGPGRVNVRIFNSDGSPRTDVITLNRLGDLAFPAQTVAALDNGYSTLAWTSQFGCGARNVVRQTMNEQGELLFGQSQINAYSNKDQRDGFVARMANGLSIVAWTATRDDSSTAINFQVYDNNLAPYGEIITAENTTLLYQSNAYIVPVSNTTFTLLWNFFNPSSGATGVQGGIYSIDGIQLGSIFTPEAVSDQLATLSLPVGTLLQNNRLALTWVEGSNTIAGRVYQCSQDCELSEWSPWSECSVQCGGGTQTRSRTVLKPAFLNGSPCESILVESQECNVAPCADPLCAFCLSQSASNQCYYVTSGLSSRQQAIDSCSQNCSAQENDENCLVNIQNREERAYIVQQVIPNQILNNGSLIASEYWIGKWQGSDYGGLCLALSQYGAVTVVPQGCNSTSVSAAICQVTRPDVC